MNLADLVKHINLATDEDFLFADVTQFINDAIAKINIECSAVFPEFDPLDPSYVHPIPVKWQRALFVPFAAGRIKENDSSQFEYNDWYAQFVDNLITFRSKYSIPEEFIDTDDQGSSFPPDFAGNWNRGDW